MARYVLLAFDDNKEADNFIEGMKVAEGTQVVGLFMKPTLFCDCPATNKGKGGGWSMGPKYGLWVHTCGKPGKMAWENIAHKLTGFGYNLLLPAEERSRVASEASRSYYKGLR